MPSGTKPSKLQTTFGLYDTPQAEIKDYSKMPFYHTFQTIQNTDKHTLKQTNKPVLGI